MFEIAIVILVILSTVLLSLGMDIKLSYFILNRLGLKVCMGDMLKDYKVARRLNNQVVGYISINGTCYAPILANSGYKDKSILNKFDRFGEVHIDDSKSSVILQKLGSNRGIFGDFTTIVGSVRGSRYGSLRRKGFSKLYEYSKSELMHNDDTISILSDEGCKKYYTYMAVDISIASREDLSINSRSSFIESLGKFAYYKCGKVVNITSTNFLFLRCNTDINSYILVLVER